MKKLLMIVFFAVISITGNSQNFTWNLVSKINDSRFCHYIGQVNGNHFLVVSKFSIKNDFPENTHSGIQYTRKNVVQFLKFDEKFNLISSKPLVLHDKLFELFETYIVKDKILFYYSAIIGENKYKLSCDELDLEGTLLGQKDMIGCGYNFPKRELLVFGGKPITFYDYNYKEIANFPVLETASDIVETSNGDFIALLRNQSIMRMNPETKKSEILKLDYKDLFIQNSKIKVSGDYLFVASTYGGQGKWKFEHKGIIVKKIHLPTFKEEKQFESAFNSDILLRMSGEKSLDKVSGLKNVTMKSIHVTENGSLITVMEPCDIESSTYVSGNTSRTTYSSWYGSFILARFDSEGKSIQKIQSKYSSGMSIYEYLLSHSAFYKDKHFYLLYNVGNAPYTLHLVKMDADLNVVSDTEIKTYKEHGLYFGVRNCSMIGENKYLVWGRWQNKFGSFSLEF